MSRLYALLLLISLLRFWQPDSPSPVALIGTLGGDHIYALAWSPDGRYLAAGSTRNIYIYDTQDWTIPPVMLSGHDRPVFEVQFSWDGQWLYTNDGTVYQWEVATWQLLQTTDPTDYRIRSFAFNEKHLAFDNGVGGVFITSLAPDMIDQLTNNDLPGMAAPPQLHRLVFTPDGKQVVLLAGQSTFETWGGPMGDMLLVPAELTESIWDLPAAEASGMVKRLHGHAEGVQQVTFNAAGTHMFSAGLDGNIMVWEMQTGTTLGTVPAHGGAVLDIGITPDHRLISGGGDGKLRFWEAATLAPLETIDGYRTALTALELAPDGTQLAIGGWDGRIWIMDMDTGEQHLIRESTLTEIWEVAFHPEGQLIAAAGDNNDVFLWGLDGSLRVLQGHTGPVYSVAFSPDGTILASGSSDHTVRLWDVLSGESLGVLAGHERAVYGVAFAPQGLSIASASWDGTARLWSLEDQAERYQFGEIGSIPIYDVQFSPDGRWLAYGALYIIDFGISGLTDTPQEQAYTQIPLYWSDTYYSSRNDIIMLPAGAAGHLTDSHLRYTLMLPDYQLNQQLVFSVSQGAIALNGGYTLFAQDNTLIDMNTGNTLFEFPALNDGAHSRSRDMVFSPDGTQLARVDSTGLIQLWHILHQ